MPTRAAARAQTHYILAVDLDVLYGVNDTPSIAADATPIVRPCRAPHSYAR